MQSEPVNESEREAILRGLAELDAGLARPLEEFDAEFGKRHGILIDQDVDGPQSSDS
ncbi:hypothetical protein [Aeoliella sp. SH292]|uniref:hypothetical protein n=1 Tax=Aeoliella sp. SH292 TaxID=3454464 RepID=UPI003F967F5A